MSENQAKIDSVVSLTGATPDQAAFYLESSGWNVDIAVNEYYESVGAADDDGLNFSPERSRGPARAFGGDAGVDPQPAVNGPPAARGAPWPSSSSRDAKKSGKRTGGAAGKIKTLNDLQNRGAHESDDESDGPNEYYTGGEKSGMMVQDPNRPQRQVDTIFDMARQHGAREGTSADLPGNSRAQAGGGTFRGKAYTLSGEPTAEAEGQAGEGGPSEPPKQIVFTITFWRNGFTVNDGPLRALDDPANRPFLESINRGHCPRELEPSDRNTPVAVNLVRQDREYTPPPEPSYRAFTGTGYTLGGSSSQPPQEPVAPPAATGPAQPAPRVPSVLPPAQGIQVDPSQPSTSIQLRLMDGTRMVAHFNLSHTVADVRNFISAARPGGPAAYTLQAMGFPPKTLSDMEQTVEAAGLANSVIIQKM